MSIDVNVQNDLVIVTESSEDITVNVSNAAGPAGANGVGVPTGGSTGQVLKKLTNTDYDTYWALDGGGVPYSGATGDVNLGEFQLRAGQLTLDTSPTGTAVVGTTRWNDTIGSSETTLKGGSVVLKNGVDLVARIVNKVTPNATLTKAAYQAVRVSGAQGQRLAVAYAQANNDANSADTIGLVCETIQTNQEGFIITMGQLENINTTGSLQGETWVDGDVLYLSPFTPGAVTKVKPTGAGHIVVIGYVEYAHVNNGKIYVKVMNGWELDELHDVDIVSPANNDALIYESSTALWKNKTIATALGYTPISGSGVAGQVAYWNGTNSQTGSNNLFWDAANSRLGIGTNAPAFDLSIVKSTTATIGIRSTTSTEYVAINFYNSANAIVGGFGYGNSGTADLYKNKFYFAGVSSVPISFIVSGSEYLRMFPLTGNLVLQNSGTFTDGGQRLQVYGDAFIKGSADTFATAALTIQNNSGSSLFRVLNTGQLRIGSTGNNPLIYPQTNVGTVESISGTNLSFYSYTGSQSASSGRFFFGGENMTQASGANYNIFSAGKFFPASGTATFADIIINPQVSQTGGANGITRGLYVNPTLTAAADWRSIEWSNNSGWGLYGAGTANNYLNGNLGIGTTSPSSKLNVSGTGTLANFGTISTNGVVISTNANGTGLITAWNYDTLAPSSTSIAASAVLGFNGSPTNFYGAGVGEIRASAYDIWFQTGAANGGGYRFYKGITEMFTIYGNGNVGIGTGSTNSGFKLDVNGTARVSDQITSSKTSGSAFTMNSNAFFQYSNNDILCATASNIIGGGTSGFGIRYASAAVFGTGTIGCQYFTTNNATFYAGSISVNLGSLVNASAVLQCESTTKGFLPPRMTTTQKNAIATPSAGLQVYDTTLNQMSYYNGTTWINF